MPLSKEESEEFLNRVVSVLELERNGATPHQWTVLVDVLDELLETRSPYQVTNEMIHGAWDVTTHIHPVDGSIQVLRGNASKEYSFMHSYCCVDYWMFRNG